ncbi:hypothetical protein DSM112329_01776 [Paraconexibacter sp. AEG42_29]|uniref:Uncharacterized protein n=1 Tax=Paraconexibacter sp. AEG42_29 TaxID=2997339 RepID=A0AAU7ATK8_9ACTN
MGVFSKDRRRARKARRKQKRKSRDNDCFFLELFDDSCYVATAAHGDLDAPEVVALRRYRDERLLTNPAGRAFTAAYYAVLGPAGAAVLNRFPRLKAPARRALAPAVRWARRTVR